MFRVYSLRILFLAFLYSGCSNVEKKSHDDIAAKAKERDSSIYQCMYKWDTIISEGTFVKYIVVDSFYTVEVSIQGKDTILGYQFDCRSPHKYVPKFFYNDSNSIYLVVCSSPNDGEITICELINGQMKMDSYRMERSAESNRDIFIYKIASDKTKLFAKGAFNLKKERNLFSENNKAIKMISLPKEFQDDTIGMTEVKEIEIVVNFTNGKRLILPLK
ncbi:MAG: hypothetical protein ABI723_05045 [Bacteroidia bacterium]